MSDNKYRCYLNGQRAVLRELNSQRHVLVQEAEQAGKQEQIYTKARDIINIVIQATQKEIITFIEEVVELGLSAVYGSGYSFEFEMMIKRNKSEAVPWIVKNGKRFDPRTEVGGGILDVGSISLRMACWVIDVNKTASVFFLDEPGKFISESFRFLFGEMLKKLSETLKVQLIINTHDVSLMKIADKRFLVTQKNNISMVKYLTEEQGIQFLEENYP